MLVVAERPGIGLAATRPSPWDHVVVRARSFTLDSELARGVPPEASPRLALRAQQLVGSRSRRGIADGIRRALADAERPGAERPGAAPVCRERVRAAATELRALAGRLLSAAPLPARGVAQARLLLCDAGGPLYRVSGSDDLPGRVSAALGFLDPLSAW
jgi:hypothetical protein